MAQKVTVSLVDDLDGSEATETVTFGLDGNTYEVDLSERNAKELRDGLAHFVAVARKSSKGSARRSRSASAGPSISAQVREWAVQNGHDVPSRGRIPTAVMEAYRETHGGSEAAPVVAEANTEQPKAKTTRKASTRRPKVEPVG